MLLLAAMAVLLLGYLGSRYVANSDRRVVDTATSADIARLGANFGNSEWRLVSRFDERLANHYERVFEMAFNPVSDETISTSIGTWFGDDFHCAPRVSDQWTCEPRTASAGHCQDGYRTTYAKVTARGDSSRHEVSGLTVRIFGELCN
ncbi:MAG: hypothetical protein DCC49_13450 [Acidobacteria bacterium]|nr:MAG: hypothetical protein DCC49_13450 [Acidobacteriota bacterium]